MLDQWMKLSAVDMRELPAKRQRQVLVCDQLGIFAFFTPLPYQLFYIFYDLAYFSEIFIINLMFMSCYATVLLLNRRGEYGAARNLLMLCVSTHMFVSSLMAGSGVGVNLFYFTQAAVLVFLFPGLCWLGLVAWQLVCGALYLGTQLLLTSEVAITPVPHPWVDLMYVCSASGALLLMVALLNLFRHQIENTEKELLTTSQMLQVRSSTDPLTGLANRRALDEALRAEWLRLARHPGTLSVIMCDVDHFKGYNDYFGHDGGDECLRQIAWAIKEVLERPSDLAVRYGGEEFAVVLPATDEQGARHVGEKINEAVRRLAIPNPHIKGGIVTVSVGVSSSTCFTSTHFEQSGERLLKCADQALYLAKKNGRDQTVCMGCYSLT
ncbi:diguanylate cyclase [Halomonas sp. PAMB 3264]|uniref:diguanylate cyclase n=1 Tax=unclassified Halomonas TaxID=2609666 RepID=UPI00289E04EB|nr:MULTISPECIES: diguanylate cyclase [unclassified Halomonas]WNL38275.1 diguanylate cyclase [Halomonas sp. PAMB 3232]WNL41575.1 diguanylate cyclase [Halomonas sp. PAMB 3264]